MKSLNMRLIIAIIITLIFSIFPLPAAISGCRPPFTLMLLLYIQCFLPNQFNLLLIFIVGLCMDALMSTVMGEHVFALSLTTWIFNGKSRRFHFFTMGQQMLLIGAFGFIYEFSLFLVSYFSGFYYSWIMVLASSVFGMFFWPWIKILADDTLLLIKFAE
ncbi:rod shape-determining protein MreD [Legionella israelensis]|uniref:rod shape-determining protein MreD n=1 Tax=Legionella israelensis TaxID=454 RepID=UPI00117C7758|nr:rod shape-determining protein MreD [Legionella israelensis]QDP72452.1 rod shape-determining protein MreD [Legionella israelensis]